MFYELTDMGLIKISGVDAQKFLQGQLTCDVFTMQNGSASFAAHCNPQGRVVSLFYLFLWNGSYYLLMQRAMLTIAMMSLKKFSVFFKTEITDVSDEFMLAGVASHTVNADDLLSIPVLNNRHILVGDRSVIKRMQQDLHLETSLLNHWHYLNILAGIPTIYPETTGKFLPHEINLQCLNAISFDKGCYTGQEIIARMHYRGKLKNQMYVAEVAGEYVSQPGMDIYASEGKVAGTVVAITQDVYNKQKFLLVIVNDVKQNLYLTTDVNSVLAIKN